LKGVCSSKDLRAGWVLAWEGNAEPMLLEQPGSCAVYGKDAVAAAVSPVQMG